MSWTEDWLWPKVDLRRRAQNAIDEGFYAAAFLGGFKFVFGLIFLLAQFSEAVFVGLVSAAIFGGLAFGIYKRSRFCALAALIFFLAQRFLLGTELGVPNLLYTTFFSLLFVNGIRGAFAYRRFGPPANAPSVEESFRAMAKAVPAEEPRAKETES
jgi:hypothetical protein